MYEMHEKIDGLKMAVAACVGLLTGLWGWMGWLAVGWIVCMGLDYLTGSMAAANSLAVIRPPFLKAQTRSATF